MNPEHPRNPQEELEARLTALLFGELSAAEAAAMHRAIERDGELARLFARLHHTISLVRETAATPTEPAIAPAPLKLSEERRQKLLAQFKTLAPREFTPEKRSSKFRLIELAALLAIVALLAAMLLPAFSKSKAKAQRISVLNNLKQIDIAKQQWASENNKTANDAPTFDDIKPYLGREKMPDVAGETYVLGKVGEPPSAEVAAVDAKQTFGRFSANLPRAGRGDRVRLSSDGGVSTVMFGTSQANTPSPEAEQLAFLSRGTANPQPAIPAEAQPSDHYYYQVAAIDPALAVTPTTQLPSPPRAQIVLPPPDVASDTAAVPQSFGQEQLGESLKVESLVRSLDGSAGIENTTSAGSFVVDPSTGLPVTRTLAEPRSSENDEAFRSRYGSVASPAPTAGAANVWPIDKLRAGLKNTASPTSSQALAFGGGTVPEKRLPVGMGGGGGGGGGGAATPEAIDGTVRGFYDSGEESRKAKEGKSVDYQDRVGGTVAGAKLDAVGESGPISGDFAGEPLEVAQGERFAKPSQKENRPVGFDLNPGNRAKGSIELPNQEGAKGPAIQVPALGDTPVLGMTFTNSVGYEVAATTAGDSLASGRMWTDNSQHFKQGNAAETSKGITGVATDPEVRQLMLLPERGRVSRSNVYSLDVAGYTDVAANGGRLEVAAAESASRSASSKALPPSQGRVLRDTKIDSGGKKIELAELPSLRRRADVELADLPIRKPATNAPTPQPEVQTSENAFSTFSLNVSDVSFKLTAASLERGLMPDVATVRSEEFINAFDYHDPEPLPGAPIAFAWERARYPFAVNRDLLRFSLKTAAAGRQAGRPLNIVLLLDNSGSMERADRVQIIREALRVLASQLQPQDKLSVITFARTPRLVVDGISGDKAGEVAGQVGGLTPQGGTNLEEAMNLAYETAARHYLVNGINRVVLLTDGAANLGDVEPASLKQKVEAARQQGIALDCFGVGWEGFNDDLLEVLSRNGDGRYGFINSPEDAATDFVGQLAGALKVAASDVKVQVEFNPARVTSYRQIGYAKHQLTKEQFRDNTVDAAEIAAQEAGNALYTVEVNPAGSGPLGTVRVRYKIPGTTDYREQAWDVPYTGNALALDQSSPAMRLAASASAFAEWLVASPFAGEVAPDALLGYLRSVPEVFGADSRPKKLEWMIRQAKSIEGK